MQCARRYLHLPDGTVVDTLEGEAALRDCLKDLRQLQPLPSLVFSEQVRGAEFHRLAYVSGVFRRFYRVSGALNTNPAPDPAREYSYGGYEGYEKTESILPTPAPPSRRARRRLQGLL